MFFPEAPNAIENEWTCQWFCCNYGCTPWDSLPLLPMDFLLSEPFLLVLGAIGLADPTCAGECNSGACQDYQDLASEGATFAPFGSENREEGACISEMCATTCNFRMFAPVWIEWIQEFYEGSTFTPEEEAEFDEVFTEENFDPLLCGYECCESGCSSDTLDDEEKASCFQSCGKELGVTFPPLP